MGGGSGSRPPGRMGRPQPDTQSPSGEPSRRHGWLLPVRTVCFLGTRVRVTCQRHVTWALGPRSPQPRPPAWCCLTPSAAPASGREVWQPPQHPLAVRGSPTAAEPPGRPALAPARRQELVGFTAYPSEGGEQTMQRWVQPASANGGWGRTRGALLPAEPAHSLLCGQGRRQRLSAGAGAHPGGSGQHTSGRFRSTGFTTVAQQQGREGVAGGREREGGRARLPRTPRGKRRTLKALQSKIFTQISKCFSPGARRWFMLLISSGDAGTCFAVDRRGRRRSVFVSVRVFVCAHTRRPVREGGSRSLGVKRVSCKSMVSSPSRELLSESLGTVFPSFLQHLQFGAPAITISR